MKLILIPVLFTLTLILPLMSEAKLPQKWFKSKLKGSKIDSQIFSLNSSNFINKTTPNKLALNETLNGKNIKSQSLSPLSPLNINNDDNENDNDNEDGDSSTQYKHDMAKMIHTGYATINPNSEQIENFGLNESPRKKQKGPWFLQSIRTEFGIEATGEIGFLGYQGEAAMEFIWQRTPYSLKQLQKEYFPNASKDVTKKSNFATQHTIKKSNANEQNSLLSLDTDMSKNEIKQKVQSLVAYVDQSHKIKNTEKFKKQLFTQIEKHQNALQELTYIPEQVSWKPYKYQLELYAKASGEVFPAIRVGGVIRIQIEWTIKSKSSQNSKNSPILASIDQMSAYLQQLAKDANSNPNNIYQLNQVKLGLGLSVNGDFEIVKFETSAIGIVYLKLDESVKLPPKTQLLEWQQNELLVSGINRAQWKYGIRAAQEMASSILEEASNNEKEEDKERPYRDFELKQIEVELTLSAGGELLLPTVMDTTYMELVYVKKAAKLNKGKA